MLKSDHLTGGWFPTSQVVSRAGPCCSGQPILLGHCKNCSAAAGRGGLVVLSVAGRSKTSMVCFRPAQMDLKLSCSPMGFSHCGNLSFYKLIFQFLSHNSVKLEHIFWKYQILSHDRRKLVVGKGHLLEGLMGKPRQDKLKSQPALYPHRIPSIVFHPNLFLSTNSVSLCTLVSHQLKWPWNTASRHSISQGFISFFLKSQAVINAIKYILW